MKMRQKNSELRRHDYRVPERKQYRANHSLNDKISETDSCIQQGNMLIIH